MITAYTYTDDAPSMQGITSSLSATNSQGVGSFSSFTTVENKASLRTYNNDGNVIVLGTSSNGITLSADTGAKLMTTIHGSSQTIFVDGVYSIERGQSTTTSYIPPTSNTTASNQSGSTQTSSSTTQTQQIGVTTTELTTVSKTLTTWQSATATAQVNTVIDDEITTASTTRSIQILSSYTTEGVMMTTSSTIVPKAFGAWASVIYPAKCSLLYTADPTLVPSSELKRFCSVFATADTPFTVIDTWEGVSMPSSSSTSTLSAGGTTSVTQSQITSPALHSSLFYINPQLTFLYPDVANSEYSPLYRHYTAIGKGDPVYASYSINVATSAASITTRTVGQLFQKGGVLEIYPHSDDTLVMLSNVTESTISNSYLIGAGGGYPYGDGNCSSVVGVYLGEIAMRNSTGESVSNLSRTQTELTTATITPGVLLVQNKPGLIVQGGQLAVLRNPIVVAERPCNYF